jgi:hypothetical protein
MKNPYQIKIKSNKLNHKKKQKKYIERKQTWVFNFHVETEYRKLLLLLSEEKMFIKRSTIRRKTGFFKLSSLSC